MDEPGFTSVPVGHCVVDASPPVHDFVDATPDLYSARDSSVVARMQMRHTALHTRNFAVFSCDISVQMAWDASAVRGMLDTAELGVEDDMDDEAREAARAEKQRKETSVVASVMTDAFEFGAGADLGGGEGDAGGSPSQSHVERPPSPRSRQLMEQVVAHVAAQVERAAAAGIAPILDRIASLEHRVARMADGIDALRRRRRS
jgi:hypothetical protein